MRKILFLAIIFILLFNISVFADDTEEKDTKLLKTNIEQLDKINQESKYSIENPSQSYKKGQVEEWAVRKQNEIIFFLQRIAQPFAIIIFIICSFRSLVGSITSNNILNSGILGMILSVILYTIIMYAQLIFQYAISFVAT